MSVHLSAHKMACTSLTTTYTKTCKIASKKKDLLVEMITTKTKARSSEKNIKRKLIIEFEANHDKCNFKACFCNLLKNVLCFILYFVKSFLAEKQLRCRSA